MIHTPLNYSSAEQWAGFPYTPADRGEAKERGVNKEAEEENLKRALGCAYGIFFLFFSTISLCSKL